MGMGPRAYSVLTIKRLFSLSGNKCAFPGCEINFTNPDNTFNFSNICHIESAEKGGQRYNSEMSDKERADYNNLILLCPNHHKETDDESIYTVSKLKKIKKEHELLVLKRMGTEVLNKYPSSLAEIVNHISAIDLDEVEAMENTHAYSLVKKIEYNNIKRFRPILDEYMVYQGKLNRIYSEIDRQGSFKKENLLKNIRILYLETKGELLEENTHIQNIRRNADRLIERVESKLWDLFEKSPNANYNLPFEAINHAMRVIIVDAFIRCKILEEPK